MDLSKSAPEPGVGILHKKYPYNMLKCTESIEKGKTPVDKIVILSYNTKYRNRLQFTSDLEDGV